MVTNLLGNTGEENITGGGHTAGKGTEEQVGGGQMADKGSKKEKQNGGRQTAGGDGGNRSGKTEESEPKKKCSTQSAVKLWEKKRQSVMKEQEQRWKEATEKHDTVSTEVDLEDAMMSSEEEDKQDEQKEKTAESEGYG